MANTENTFVKSLRAIASETLRARDEHPEPEELLAYNVGELSEDRACRIGAHLAICPDCTQSVLDLAAFPDVELQDENLRRTLEEEEADWIAIRKQIGTEGTVTAPPPAIRRRIPFSWVHAVAAGLAAVVLGLSLWVTHLELQIRRSSNLEANLYIKDLLPASAGSSRDEVAGNTVSVPAGLDHSVLVLALADFEPFPDYQVKVFDSAGALRWSRAGLVRLPDGSFTLEVKRDLLPSGAYQIKLYGLKSKQQKLLATYPFRIVYPAS